MKLSAIVTLGILASTVAGVAIAQQAPQLDAAAIQNATEQMLMEQMRARREWQAMAISKDETITKQANTIAVLQKELAQAKAPKAAAAEETPPK